MFLSGLFIHNNNKIEITQCLSMDERLNKMWYTHKIEYYLAIRGMKYWYML